MSSASGARPGAQTGGEGEAIGFRPLRRDDLPLMYRWINTPHVARWWDAAPSLADVEAEYLPAILDPGPAQCYAILLAGEPIGFIQTYLIRDHADYAAAVDVDPGAAGVDLFIGERALVRRGLGPRVLQQFIHTIVFARDEVRSCVIGPAASNAGAIRAYEKAGFRYLKTVVVPGEAEPEYLLELTRAGAVGQ
ncbi:MAG TPA: GNAT family N-acetyltransferase [Dehalococcoidia bacterium]|nr:GNAT family N-acetyltransferase [Dehalococcoidia bacterium]